jgi:hypothetical protein
MLTDALLGDEDLDYHDRARASDMEERPIYPAPVLGELPAEEETRPDEREV